MSGKVGVGPATGSVETGSGWESLSLEGVGGQVGSRRKASPTGGGVAKAMADEKAALGGVEAAVIGLDVVAGDFADDEVAGIFDVVGEVEEVHVLG